MDSHNPYDVAQFRDPEAEVRAAKAVARLPLPLRDIGYALLKRDEAGHPLASDPRQQMRRLNQGCQTLVEQPLSERAKLISILFPKIQRYILLGWEMHTQRSYMTGIYKMPFRAPQQPSWFKVQLTYWLQNLIICLLPYDQDILWIAEHSHSSLLGWSWEQTGGMLLAAAIDAGDEQSEKVLQTLLAIARGDRPPAVIGRYFFVALLNCSEPEAWRFVEQMLMAAQRQEGVRQVILESVDIAHPEAFRRMVGFINAHNLVRFNSVIRAVNVWLQLNFEVTQTKNVQKALTLLERFWEDPILAERAIQDDDPQTGYIALLSFGFGDVEIALDKAGRLLVVGNPDQRLMAARFLALTGSPGGNERLVHLLHDADEHIVAVALQQLALFPQVSGDDLFQRVEQLIVKLPAKTKDLPPRIWPWWKLRLNPQWAGQLLVFACQGQSLQPVLPYLDILAGYQKSQVIYLMNQAKTTWDEATRQAVLKRLGDRSRLVRQAAAEGLGDLALSQDEVEALIEYLTRKTPDLRQSVLRLILNQTDELVLSCITALLAAPHVRQRQAGLEMLAKLFTEGRQASRCQEIAADYREKSPDLDATETALLELIPVGKLGLSPPLTIEDGLGLFDDAQRTRPIVPRQLEFQPITSTALDFLRSLDQCIVAHQDLEFEMRHEDGRRETQVLGHLRWLRQFPQFDNGKSLEANFERLPHREIWLTWWESQQKELFQGDGFDLFRAIAVINQFYGPPQREQLMVISPPNSFWQEIRHLVAIQAILKWLIWLAPPTEAAFDFILDGVEFTFWHLLHSTEHKHYWLGSYRSYTPGNAWLNTMEQLMSQFEATAADRHPVRLWQLLRWRDEPTLVLPQGQGAGVLSKVREALSKPLTPEKLKQRLLGEEAVNYTRMPRNRPSLDVLMAAYVRGAANDHDLFDRLIGPSNALYHKKEGAYGHQFNDGGILRQVSTYKPSPRTGKFGFHPAVQKAVTKIRCRIIELELQRGDLPTPASRLAMQLRYSGGAETLIRLLQAFGEGSFARAYAFHGESRQMIYSHLIRATLPSETDTSEQFAALRRQTTIGEKRWIETAVYAPQWASHIEVAVGWEGLTEAVWWFHAHNKDMGWHVPSEIREAWSAEINTQTPLRAQDLLDGAVDVAWFKRAYARLGPQRWAALHHAARYASISGGHMRAQLFAQAMLGQIAPDVLIQRIRNKRHQDSVRALGLLPLPETGREDALLERYLLLHEFLQGSKKFGSQRQASEKLAVRIALENLARTAGYGDPLRLEWRMEQRAVADLMQGPVHVVVENVTVSLSIDESGEPEIGVERQLKSGVVKSLLKMPANVKKQPEVMALISRQNDLRRQASRSRLSLENAMIRGDWFTSNELETLCRHPVLGPMLKQLVFYREDDAMGYPVMGGAELEGIRMGTTRLGATDRLRIAHPHDFLTHDWHLWQQECFRRERIQPFKQIFRELYVVTQVELEDHDFSRRYAGQEVNPRQALALFGQRGWVTHPEEGTRKTFHDENLTAHVQMLNGVLTPMEVGGGTIETISFSKRGDWQRLPLRDIPPRIFSEVMRDLDLVVSVAHLSGVDPEATQSSIELRGSLVRETVDLLKLNNVTVKERHVLIDGQLNSYSIHLGSGTVHQRPGGYVCIVPVHNSQRGRVFLPFADKDPKTAEIIAKTVMLARDSLIKDPVILAQLVRGKGG